MREATLDAITLIRERIDYGELGPAGMDALVGTLASLNVDLTCLDYAG